MLYHNIRVMAHFRRVVDPVTVALAAVAVWWVGSERGAWDRSATLSSILVLTFSLVFVFAFLSARAGIYHGRRAEKLHGELVSLAEVTLYAGGFSAVATEILSPGLPGLAYLGMLVVSTAALVTVRLSSRALVRYLRRRGKDDRTWLLVGRNERSARIAREIVSHPHFGIRIRQVVDLPGSDAGGESRRGKLFAEEPLSQLRLKVLTDVEELHGLVSSTVIDEVVVTLPVRSFYDEVERALQICNAAGISVKLFPESFEMPQAKTEFSRLGAIPLVTHYTGPSNHFQLVVKRLTDVIGALVGLTLLSPLLVVFGCAIRIASPGPILFRQTRVGLHGRRFRMLKFRTMLPDAPRLRTRLSSQNETDGAAFKIENDPRLFPLGRWLRRYHLDELPQLWNVLVGDMSLVGPRPLPVREACGSEWWQRRRLSMPPGLTCLWQVEGNPRIPFKRWMEMDLEYIDRWSIWLDLRLIAATFGTVARGSGW